MYPRPAEYVSQVRLAILQWEEKWNTMVSKFGGDVKIPDLWRMSAFLEMCPKDLQEQMMMRLDEIGENCERTSRRRWCQSRPNKTEQPREDRMRCI